MKNKFYNKYDRAKLRVERIRKFYNHLIVFILFNGVLFLLKDKMAEAILGEQASTYPEAMNWVYWNLFIWLLIICIHACVVFGKVPNIVKKWEERQLKKYLNQ